MGSSPASSRFTDFSKDAHDYVSKIESKIVLIDGLRLAKLMIEFGVAVATDATYTVKRMDNDYFDSIWFTCVTLGSRPYGVVGQ